MLISVYDRDSSTHTETNSTSGFGIEYLDLIILVHFSKHKLNYSYVKAGNRIQKA